MLPIGKRRFYDLSRRRLNDLWDPARDNYRCEHHYLRCRMNSTRCAIRDDLSRPAMWTGDPHFKSDFAERDDRDAILRWVEPASIANSLLSALSPLARFFDAQEAGLWLKRSLGPSSSLPSAFAPQL